MSLPEKQKKKKLHIKIKLKYKGNTYEFIDDHSKFTFEMSDEPSEYWWKEGNGACDCNRSLFIKRYCDNNFPEMECGDDIELLSQKFIGDWKGHHKIV